MVDALAAKHPDRRRPVEARSHYKDWTTPTVDVCETLRNLPRRRGTGNNAQRNEHLIPLGFTYGDASLKGIGDRVNAFAN